MSNKWIPVLIALIAIEGASICVAKEPEPTPLSRIDLGAIGYTPTTHVHHSDREVFDDLTLLMQDEDKRVSFAAGSVLAVYYSRPPEKSKDGTSSNYAMEVFFIGSDSGKLIEHRTWHTLKRQWFNDEYDTEGRIMQVRTGFLVDAGAKLELYDRDLRLRKTYDLKASNSGASGMWSVKVAPGGDTIHVQSSKQTVQVRRGAVSYFAGADEIESSWLQSDSFQKIGSQPSFGGPHSVSNDAIVTRLSHCLDLQRMGEPPHRISCSKPPAGLPMFLNDNEILSVGVTEFSILSTQGILIWNVGEPDPGVRRSLEIDDYQRSMDGSRFAIALTGYRKKAMFDGIYLPRRPLDTIVVYDENCLQHVFTLTIPAHSPYALSPEGRTLAVLTGTTLTVFALPKATCGSK